VHFGLPIPPRRATPHFAHSQSFPAVVSAAKGKDSGCEDTTGIEDAPACCPNERDAIRYDDWQDEWRDD
jgi:hypothetical protein